MRHGPTSGKVLTLFAALVFLSARSGWCAETDHFGRMHRLIKPQDQEEKWMQIPWMASLWDARQKAAGAGKPILLWEMDGHPLGCT